MGLYNQKVMVLTHARKIRVLLCYAVTSCVDRITLLNLAFRTGVTYRFNLMYGKDVQCFFQDFEEGGQKYVNSNFGGACSRGAN